MLSDSSETVSKACDWNVVSDIISFPMASFIILTDGGNSSKFPKSLATISNAPVVAISGNAFDHSAVRTLEYIKRYYFMKVFYQPLVLLMANLVNKNRCKKAEK